MSSRINENASKLFEFWCEIKPSGSPSDKVSGQIVDYFPKTFKDVDKFCGELTPFVYPCKIEIKNIEVYSFVLTDSESKWRFGFCRHDPRYPNAIVLITYLAWHDTFIKYLNQLAEIKKSSYEDFYAFLSFTYNSKIPEKGSTLRVPFTNGSQQFLFTRPLHFQLPNVLTSHNLRIYYSVMTESKFIIAIFAAMLAERRIIFKSNSLNKLSACIQAAHAFLYPMMWQHIFIPILPMKMKDYLSAPMPYLIGAPEMVLNTVDPNIIGDAVIFDCDRKILNTPFDDEKKMPVEIISFMKRQLNSPVEHGEDKFSKIFLGVLVQLIGGYRDALNYTDDRNIKWDPEAFIESRPHHLRPFLRNMLELQIFQQFIEERLDLLRNSNCISDEFELEIVRYAEKGGKKKLYKELFRSVKEKTNPAMKNAVKSVREANKGVKTAYKDWKSKKHDSPPQKSYGSSRLEYNGGPHSAPSSPVFVKRDTSDGLHSRRVVHNHMSQQSSHTIWHDGSGYHNNNNNINSSKSPALSPASSTDSTSDMNLLQEIQQHPCFRSPAVDRTLKPSSKSIDYVHHTRSPAHRIIGNDTGGGGYQNAMQSLATTKTQWISNSNKCFPSNTPSLSTKPSSTQIPTIAVYKQQPLQPQQVPIGMLCLLDETQPSSSSAFDASPEIPSPPVPPPRNNKHISYSSSPQPPTPSSSSSSPPLNVKPVLNSSCLMHNSDVLDFVTSSQNSLQTSSPQAKPILSLNCKPPSDNVDLIKLDTHPNYELEDLDPLNQDAKPLPPLPPLSTHPNSLSLSNPLYPYVQPTPRVPPRPMQLPNHADDSDLLRQYGLDKFPVLHHDTGDRTAAYQQRLPNNGVAKNPINDWIKFN